MANKTHMVILDDAGKVIRFIEDQSALLWYHRFNTGMKYRMGYIWRPNKALSSTDWVVRVINKAEERCREGETATICH